MSVRLRRQFFKRETSNYAERCELITDNSLWKHILSLLPCHSIIKWKYVIKHSSMWKRLVQMQSVTNSAQFHVIFKPTKIRDAKVFLYLPLMVGGKGHKNKGRLLEGSNCDLSQVASTVHVIPWGAKQEIKEGGKHGRHVDEDVGFGCN